MKTFAGRRWRNLALTFLLAAAVIAAGVLSALTLNPPAFVSGWFLLGVILLLACYNVRKRLPFLPLGSSASWLQLHIYAGLLTAVLFAVHVHYRVPNGIFEGTLAALYAVVFGSGIVGLILSRVIPPRLTTHSEELFYEEIPVVVRHLHDEVQQMVLEAAETDTSVIPEFYVNRLKRYFDRPRHFWQHLVQSARPRQRLLMEIHAQHRFLNDKEREIMDAIADRVDRKYQLDYQYALQSTLKYWLFAHVPLTYALLAFAAAHVILVYAFSGIS